MARKYFTNATFTFLSDLTTHNNRDWFQQNKHRYEDHLKEPAIRFIIDFGPHLKEISEHFRADPRPVGGSMFRIYRDMRFTGDKTPYKTHLGIQFRHDHGRDVHAPGFYLHLETSGSFAGAGMWRPDAESLKRVREAITEDPQAYKRAVGTEGFEGTYSLEGDRLKRMPRGFDAEHPLADDLKRKDFVGVARISKTMATGSDLPHQLAAVFRESIPFMKFLCGAIGVPF